jgi:hypothetical protein
MLLPHLYRTRAPRQDRNQPFVPSTVGIDNFREKLYRTIFTLYTGRLFPIICFCLGIFLDQVSISASRNNNYCLPWSQPLLYAGFLLKDWTLICLLLLSRVLLLLNIVSSWFSNGHFIFGTINKSSQHRSLVYESMKYKIHQTIRIWFSSDYYSKRTFTNEECLKGKEVSWVLRRHMNKEVIHEFYESHEEGWREVWSQNVQGLKGLLQLAASYNLNLWSIS